MPIMECGTYRSKNGGNSYEPPLKKRKIDLDQPKEWSIDDLTNKMATLSCSESQKCHEISHKIFGSPF